MAVKRNLKALRRLRGVLRYVPADNLHMQVVEEATDCGTACCLFGWGRQDRQLIGMGMPKYLHEARDFFGLTRSEHDALFFDNHSMGMIAVFDENPHAITKAQVLHSLDRVIAGKPIKPYVVKET